MKGVKRFFGGKICICIYLCICLLAGSLFGGMGGVTAHAEEKKVKVIGYLPSYRNYYIDSIDYSALTHLNLCFITYQGGRLSCGFTDEEINRVKEKCRANGVKVLIALGGGSGFDVSGGDPFETAEKRTAMVNELMGYVNRWGLDGLDIDIEIEPGNAVWNHFEAFIAELSGRLKADNKLLTIAVASWMADRITNSTYNYFDFVNLMTYDENAGNGPVASQSFVESTVNYFRGKGISDDRLTIGVPFYGYGPGGWSDAHTYAEIVAMNPNAASMDEYNNIYYNGADTIKRKAEYAKNFGGIMIWELAQDASGDASLLKAIKDTLGNLIGDSSETGSGSGSDETTYERYEVKDGEYYLVSANENKVVSIAGTEGAVLAANQNSYNGKSESIEIVNNGDGTVALKSSQNNQYVCAVVNEDARLQARSSVIDAWEIFEIVKVGDSQCALRSRQNNKFVSADFNDNGILKASSDSVAGAWEAFTLVEVPKQDEGTGSERPSEEEKPSEGDNSEVEKPSEGDNSENEKPSEGDNSEAEKPSEGNNNGNGAYEVWSDRADYKNGDLVVYNGKVYECIFAHTANAGWTPDVVPTLWKERTDLDANAAEKPSEGDESSETEKPSEGDESSEIEGPSEGDESGETEKPSEGNESSEIEKPSETDKPSETEKPSEGDESSETEKPSEGDESSEIEKPSEGDESSETEKPSEGDESSETEKPSEGNESSEIEKPSEADKPSETEKPSETKKPSEVDKLASSVTYVKTISISGDIQKVAAGRKVQLFATVLPNDASNKAVVWESSDERYATVDSKTGLVTTKKTKKIRTVTVTAKAADGSGVKQSYKLKIMPKAVKKITWKLSSKSVKAGKKIRIKAVVSPNKLVNKTLKYSSSNPKYATVNQKGVVTAKKSAVGRTVKITAMATDGSGKKKSIKIHIE